MCTENPGRQRQKRCLLETANTCTRKLRTRHIGEQLGLVNRSADSRADERGDDLAVLGVKETHDGDLGQRFAKREVADFGLARACCVGGRQWRHGWGGT